LGIASGLILTSLLAGHAELQVVALLLSIFGLFYLFLVSYTAGIFCVTLMLGLLYGMLGVPTEQLLFLRFEETAIGALAAILVAAFVFPARTRDQVMRSGRNVLTSLVEAVRASRCAMAGLAGAPPLEAMRRVDRQLADLRLALVPLTAGRTLLRRSALERPIPALLECVHWTRVLAAASHDCPQPQHTGPLVSQAAEIEARLARLAGLTASEPPSAEPAIAPVESTGASPDAGDAEIPVILDNLSAAVGILAERLQVGTFAGFAVDGKADLTRS
jgi:uncharacterized membrane protein YccC